jgi:hypothetical protein
MALARQTNLLVRSHSAQFGVKATTLSIFTALSPG